MSSLFCKADDGMIGVRGTSMRFWSWKSGTICLESSVESREYMLTYFWGMEHILLGGWKHIFIGGMGRNFWGMNPPWICTPVGRKKQESWIYNQRKWIPKSKNLSEIRKLCSPHRLSSNYCKIIGFWETIDRIPVVQPKQGLVAIPVINVYCSVAINNHNASNLSEHVLQEIVTARVLVVSNIFRRDAIIGQFCQRFQKNRKYVNFSIISLFHINCYFIGKVSPM